LTNKSGLKLRAMVEPLKITGKLVSGAEKGAYFTQLKWVREQCLEKLGFAPWPGTLNLEIPNDSVAAIEALQAKEGIELVPPDSDFCSGRVFAVSVEGIPGAVVMPADDVRVHGKHIIEIISAQKLRQALGIENGDSVTIVICRA